MNQTNQVRKRRFNLIDFLMLALVVAGILALTLRGNLARQVGLEHTGERAELKLSLSALENDDADLFREGETLIDPATGEALGVIKQVRAENALFYSVSEKKEVVRAFDSSKRDLTITLEGAGIKSEKGFLLNASTFASPGDQIRVLCAGKVFTAAVTGADLIREPEKKTD